MYTDKEQLGDSTIFHWHKAFSEGRETTAFLPHVVRPLSISTEEQGRTERGGRGEGFPPLAFGKLVNLGF